MEMKIKMVPAGRHFFAEHHSLNTSFHLPPAVPMVALVEFLQRVSDFPASGS
jgi:hypothetical protein